MHVTVLPTWRLPHLFLHIRAARERLPDPANVFTYGLLLPEVLRVDSFADQRVRMRVGVGWLGTLLDRDPLGHANPPPQGPLTRFFAEQPIAAVFNLKRGDLLPKAILHALASPAAQVAREDVEHAFGRFARDINTAADKGARPSANLATDAALVTGTHGPRAAFATFREPKGGRTVYGFRADTLSERLALEVQDLYLHRPRLRRCVFCDAVFVPRNNELNCRWALHDASSHDPLEQCATDEMIEQWNTTHSDASKTSDSERDRDRERKRIDQRVYRALKKTGNDFKHPDVERVLAEREAFKDHNVKKRGPKGRPVTAEIEVLPTAADSLDTPG
jgi:hypothetical protein